MFLFHSVSYCPNILFTIIVNMFFEIKFLSRFSRSSVGDESVGKELKIIYHIFKRLITIVLIVSPEFIITPNNTATPKLSNVPINTYSVRFVSVS